jgi:hypothetical protein
MFGHLNCKVCGQKFTAPINSELAVLFKAKKKLTVDLSAAVDIYCE